MPRRHLLDHAEVHLGVAELEPRALGPGAEVGPGEHGEAEDVAVEADGGVEVVDHHGHVAVAGDRDGRCCRGHGGLHSVVGQRPEAYSSASSRATLHPPAEVVDVGIAVALRAGEDAGEHALEDARQLPVRERDVVLDRRQVAARRAA